MPAFRSPWMTAILTVVAVWLVVLGVGATLSQHRVGADLAAIERRIATTGQENSRLSDELERMRRPERLILLARQRLTARLPGEEVVIVYKSEKPDTISQSQPVFVERSHWRLWLDWFLGE